MGSWGRGIEKIKTFTYKPSFVLALLQASIIYLCDLPSETERAALHLAEARIPGLHGLTAFKVFQSYLLLNRRAGSYPAFSPLPHQ